jgi:hypothetical protein
MLNRHHMIDLKPLGGVAAFAAASLLRGHESGDVVGGEATPVANAPRAPRLGAGPRQFLRTLRVRFLPCPQHRLHASRIIFRPALHDRAMAARIFCAQLACPLGLSSGVSPVPRAMLRVGADHALAAASVARGIVSIAARRSGQVARIAALAGSTALRVLGLLRLPADAVFADARTATPARRGALADVPVTARLAGLVKPFARCLGSKPFGDWTHAFTDLISMKVYDKSLQASVVF